MCSTVLTNQQWGLSLLLCSTHFRAPPPHPSSIAIVLQTPAPSTKEVCVRCSPPPHHPPLCCRPSQPLPALPSLWLMCSICWMMDWAGRGKSSHTFSCVHMAGRLAPLVVVGGGGEGCYLKCATARCCVLTSPHSSHPPLQYQSTRPPTWTTICPLSEGWPHLLCQAAFSSTAMRKRREECQ